MRMPASDGNNNSSTIKFKVAPRQWRERLERLERDRAGEGGGGGQGAVCSSPEHDPRTALTLRSFDYETDHPTLALSGPRILQGLPGLRNTPSTRTNRQRRWRGRQVCGEDWRRTPIPCASGGGLRRRLEFAGAYTAERPTSLVGRCTSLVGRCFEPKHNRRSVSLACVVAFSVSSPVPRRPPHTREPTYRPRAAAQSE